MKHKIESEVVLIDIDSKSLRQLNSWPWPRRYYAQLLEQIESAAPALVAFDIDFSSASNVVDDNAFAESLRKWDTGKVILIAFLQYADSNRNLIVANYPIDTLRRHARVASINLYPSEDGLVRQVSVHDADHPPGAEPLALVLGDTVSQNKYPIQLD